MRLRVGHISPALSPTYRIEGVCESLLLIDCLVSVDEVVEHLNDALLVTADTSRYYLYGGQQKTSRSSGRQADMVFID